MNLIEHFVDGKVFKGTSKRTGKVLIRLREKKVPR
jgi:hypothetical protein